MGANRVVAPAAKIGEAARATGLSIDTIRFYEKSGLLRRSVRTEGGFRLFGPGEFQTLRFVRKSQELGFSLNEIRELLILRDEAVPACAHVADLLERKLAHVEEKIGELQGLARSLKGALRKCKRGMKSSDETHKGCCPVLADLSRAAAKQERSKNES